jgi:hypothetical protein
MKGQLLKVSACAKSGDDETLGMRVLASPLSETVLGELAPDALFAAGEVVAADEAMPNS